MEVQMTDTSTEQPNLTRDEYRAKILGTTHAPKSEVVEFFGMQVELRQASLGEMLEFQQREDGKSAIVSSLIARAFIPGTNVRIFEDTDEAVLMSKPFGADFNRINEVLVRLSEVNFLNGNATSGNTQ
jgi:2-hydroxy-3-keto-5-methylthiopentenyl-1-phosphate phosphatase